MLICVPTVEVIATWSHLLPAPHGLQGNYAAANAAADAWAAAASTAGRPCTAVQWGVWAEAGMAAAAGGLVARIARQARLALLSISALHFIC